MGDTKRTASIQCGYFDTTSVQSAGTRLDLMQDGRGMELGADVRENEDLDTQ